MMMIMMVVVMMVMTGVGQWRPSTDVNIIVVSLDDHNVVYVLRAMMMIVVITVMMVVVAVAVAGIREGVRGAAAESGVAVHRVNMNVRLRPRSLLCRLLCYSFGRWTMLMRLMWFMITSSQKGRQAFWS